MGKKLFEETSARSTRSIGAQSSPVADVSLRRAERAVHALLGVSDLLTHSDERISATLSILALEIDEALNDIRAQTTAETANDGLRRISSIPTTTQGVHYADSHTP